MRRPARPPPPPQTPIAERLEVVRTHSGFPSLRSFWQHLADGWSEEDGRVSYEAARNYHYDRDPKPAYVARVAELFPNLCTAEWLLSGHGPQAKADALLASDEYNATAPDLRQQLDGLEHLPLAVSTALGQYLVRLNASRWQDRKGPTLGSRTDDATRAWDLLLAPFEGRRPIPDPAFADYAMAAIHALTLALNVTTVEGD